MLSYSYVWGKIKFSNIDFVFILNFYVLFNVMVNFIY